VSITITLRKWQAEAVKRSDHLSNGILPLVLSYKSVVRTWHDVQLFVFAAQRFEWIGELTVEDWEGVKTILKISNIHF